MPRTESLTVEERATASGGSSSEVIYRLVTRVISERCPGANDLLDVGCGTGALRRYLPASVLTYAGADAVRYRDFPGCCEFYQVDLDTQPVRIPDRSAQVVAAVEIIEHMENPRAFMRELARLARPGGLIVVTTPNQLSVLSKLSLVFKNQFNAFQDAPGLYPAHRTALLETDLLRIACETGLERPEIRYTNRGRIPATRWHMPTWMGLRGRMFSDNVLISAFRSPE